MTREKIIKRYNFLKERLAGLREDYVTNERDNHPTADYKLGTFDGRTFREARREEILADMAECKVRLAKFERMVR